MSIDDISTMHIEYCLSYIIQQAMKRRVVDISGYSKSC